MISYHCDGCGREIQKTALRYTVDIDIKAAYDKLEVGLADLVRDHRAEILSLIEQMKHRSAQELEDGVYKHIRLDLCPACQRAYIRQPLRFHPEQTTPSEIDVDDFLRSLDYDKGGNSG